MWLRDIVRRCGPRIPHASSPGAPADRAQRRAACRDHVHMNSTKYHTLTEFVKYLGRTGKCRVDETEKGWFISLIQDDPMEKLSTERRLKRDRRVL